MQPGHATWSCSLVMQPGHAASSCSLVMQPDHGVSSHKLMHDTRGLCMIIKSLPVLVAMCVCVCACTGTVMGSLRWTYSGMEDLIAAFCTVRHCQHYVVSMHVRISNFLMIFAYSAFSVRRDQRCNENSAHFYALSVFCHKACDFINFLIYI